jgi:hypothetical protein
LTGVDKENFQVLALGQVAIKKLVVLPENLVALPFFPLKGNSK